MVMSDIPADKSTSAEEGLRSPEAEELQAPLLKERLLTGICEANHAFRSVARGSRFLQPLPG